MTPALALYLFAAARAETLRFGTHLPKPSAAPERPHGALVWLHLAQGQPPSAAATLVARVLDERPRLNLLLTADEPVDAAGGATWLPRPPDFPRAAGSFLETWRPDVAVWIGGPIRPVLAAKTRAAGVPMLLVNASADLAAGRGGIPGRHLLRLFDKIVALGAGDGAALRDAGHPDVEPLGPLQRSAAPIDYDHAEYVRLCAALLSRPTWYAAHATAKEIAALREAQAICEGASHRLLLIVTPADADAAAVAMRMGASSRSRLDAPPADTSLFLADLPEEDGLWYRLATVSFIGGTLGGPVAMVDPFAPAALGSAILHGLEVAPHGDRFAALDAARAAMRVAGTQSLARALGDLLAPDRAADLAYRAWAVVSEGAEATDRVAAAVCELLDERP